MSNFHLLQEHVYQKQVDLYEKVKENETFLPEESGIYVIYNTTNGKSYFGQSKNILKRLKRHASDLKKGTHPNKRLQRDFNSGSFIGCGLQLCSEKELDLMEAMYINYFKSFKGKYGYNQTRGNSLSDL